MTRRMVYMTRLLKQSEPCSICFAIQPMGGTLVILTTSSCICLKCAMEMDLDF